MEKFKCMTKYNGIYYNAGDDVPGGTAEEQGAAEEQGTAASEGNEPAKAKQGKK